MIGIKDESVPARAEALMQTMAARSALSTMVVLINDDREASANFNDDREASANFEERVP